MSTVAGELHPDPTNERLEPPVNSYIDQQAHDSSTTEVDESPLAGMRGAGDYRCPDCGYGIVTFSLLPACPMCNGRRWQPFGESRFTTLKPG